MNLKPNKEKIMVSLIGTIGWYVFFFFISIDGLCKCFPNGFKNCVDFEFLSPLHPRCHCTCTSLTTVILRYFYSFIAPFFLIYAFVSLLEKKPKSKK